MTDLVAFLRARLAEDEQVALAAIADNATGHWSVAAATGYLHEAVTDRTGLRLATGGHIVMPHMARHDPARVLREVEAKRRILDLSDHAVDYPPYRDDYTAAHALDDAFKLLALPYSDHPDYRPEWAVTEREST